MMVIQILERRCLHKIQWTNLVNVVAKKVLRLIPITTKAAGWLKILHMYTLQEESNHVSPTWNLKRSFYKQQVEQIQLVLLIEKHFSPSYHSDRIDISHVKCVGF